MANQKPTTAIYETQLFEALQNTPVSSEKAYIVVQEVRDMAGQNVIAEVQALRAELQAQGAITNEKIDSQSKVSQNVQWMLGAVLALMTILTALGAFNTVLNFSPGG